MDKRDNQKLVLDALLKQLHGSLTPLGFKKKGRKWTLALDHGAVFVQLQRSQWSFLFYVNLGIVLRGAPPDDDLESIGCRMDAVVPHNLRRIHQAACDFEDVLHLDALKQIDTLVSQFDVYAIPWLRKFFTMESIGECYRRGDFSGCMVHRHAVEILAGAES